jgi:hypothetical protein
MRTVFWAIVVALLSSLTARAEETHAAWIKYLSGTWTIENMDFEIDLKLVVDGVAASGTAKSNGKVVEAWIMGWDPQEKRLLHDLFGTTHGRVAYELIDDNTLRGPITVNGQNEVTKGTVTVTRNGPSRYTVQWTSVTVNNKKAEDRKFVVSRK